MEFDSLETSFPIHMPVGELNACQGICKEENVNIFYFVVNALYIPLHVSFPGIKGLISVHV